MSEKFQKIKKKFQINALLKTAIFGVAFGVVVSSVLVFIQKRMGVMPNPLLYVLVGLGSAILAFALGYLLCKPSDKKIAKRLDENLGLHEKVQTMVAFAGMEGDMLNLQRQDAENVLAAIPLKNIKTGKWWKHIFAPILAIAFICAAFLMPLKITAPPVVDGQVWEMNAWQKTRLKNLIETVQKSDMESEPKADVVEELEGLLITLVTVDKLDTMKSLVVRVIVNVNAIVNAVNTNGEIGGALKESTLEPIKRLGTAIVTLNGITATQELNGLQSAVAYETQIFQASVNAVETAIRTALTAIEVETTDDLYVALYTLVTAQRTVVESVEGGQTLDWAKTELDGAFDRADTAINDALLQQKINADTKDTVVSELMKIFNLSATDLPPENQTQGGGNGEDGGESDDKEPEDKPSDGGMGSGEVIYGSNDMVYYPDEDRYVSYGEVLNMFYAKVSGQMMDEKTSEEMSQFISDYFAKLYNGSKKEE